MAHFPPLTPNGVQEIMKTNSRDRPGYAPIFQVINIKNVATPKDSNGPPRFRLVLSDGNFHIQGMLATQLNDLVNTTIHKFNYVKINDYINNDVGGKKIIIILRLDVVGEGPGHKLGEPQDILRVDPSQPNIAHTAPASDPVVAPMYNRTNVAGSISAASPTKGGGNPYTSPPNKRNPYSPGGNAPIQHQGSAAPGGASKYTPISQLNMYQNRFTIKARVTSKSDIKTWSNAKGEGTLCSIEVLDHSGMDMRITMFKEAVDKFYNYFQIGSVYTITGGKLKVANQKFNTCKSNYEMTIDQNTEVALVDDTGDIKSQSFDFVKISHLENVPEGKNVDIIAIAQEVGDVQTLVSKKSGQELQKSDVTLIDDTGVQVRLTLWGKQAVEAKSTMDGNKVVAFRRARVSDYGGKSLSGGDVHIEPNVPETEAIREWWSSQGSRGGPTKSLSSTGNYGKIESFSERKTIADIKGQNLGYNNPDKGDYLSFKGTFTFLKKDKEGGAWYTACPNKEEPCRNRCKVTQTTDGNWQCDRCHGVYPNCTRKWIFSATVGDDTASTWVNIFDEQAQQLLGVSADEVFAQYENQDMYDGYFAKATNTEWIFKCRVKNEMVNDEPRLKTQVLRMDPVDYAAECRDMIAALEKL
jgi:replication factor A1